MKEGWKSVPLGEIATPVARPVEVQPGRTYRTIGVRWWGEGAYEREAIDGTQTAAKTLSLVRRDDLIINKIWVRHGSVAIADQSVDGCGASAEFPTFTLDRERVLPMWLHWYSKTRACWHACDVLSRGTSGKNRIRPEQFLTIHVPLPPLATQRRIASWIEEMAARIGEARQLRRQTMAQCDRVCADIVLSCQNAVPTPMGELVRTRTGDTTVEDTSSYHFAGVYCFGRGVFRGAIKTGAEFSYRSLTRLVEGEFVYPKLMAWEGALGIVPSDCDGLYVSPEFPVFTVDQSRVLPEVLDTYFRSPQVWPLLSEISTGTNLRRRRLQPSEFLRFRIPLPPMDVQERLRDAKRRLDHVRILHKQTSADLNSLLPALLDRAFSVNL